MTGFRTLLIKYSHPFDLGFRIGRSQPPLAVDVPQNAIVAAVGTNCF